MIKNVAIWLLIFVGVILTPSQLNAQIAQTTDAGDNTTDNPTNNGGDNTTDNPTNNGDDNTTDNPTNNGDDNTTDNPTDDALTTAFESNNLTPDLLWVILVGMVSGTIGGAVSVGIQHLNSSSQQEFNSFWKERLGVGAGAGVVVIWFVKPDSFLALLTFSIISGSVGPAVFVALQDRIQSTLQIRQAKDETDRAQEIAEQKSLKANPQRALETWTRIRDQFHQMRDQDEAPSQKQWDELWEAIRELEIVTPKQGKNIFDALYDLWRKRNGPIQNQESELIEKVDAAINQAGAFIKENHPRTNAPSQS